MDSTPERGPMKRFSFPRLARGGTGLNDRRVGEGVGKGPVRLHASEGGEGLGEAAVVAMGFDESVPEEGGRGEDTEEDGGGVVESGEGV